MKYIALALALVAIFAASCSAPSGPNTNAAATPDAYFYPPTNGLRYIYEQNNSATPVGDTSMYQVVVGTTFGSYAKLIVKSDSVQTGSVLYYYKVDESNGVKCILSQNGSDQGIVALQGNLQIGSSWSANTSGSITATIVGRYADYFLPGRQQLYHDVIAVKYVDNKDGDSAYILRIFAKDFGLILEQTITNETAQTSNLQLLGRLAAPNTPGTPDDRGHWYDQRGRFMMSMNPDDPNYK